tara:strand:+ start:1099 stop:2730 length:1632 start_codon:yes stop_codon:yes gene_type:complete
MFNNEFGAKVDRNINAYQGNPEKLKQQYGISKELSKLIAYQELVTEREALENDAMLRREQQPTSLVEQYENKLVQGKADNMMARAGRVGSVPQQTQGQRPPMPQGATQGIAAQPRPNMQNMAQGGIVGYYAGGTVTPDELTALGMDSASFEALPEKQQDSLLSSLKLNPPKPRVSIPPAGGLTGKGVALGQPTNTTNTTNTTIPPTAKVKIPVVANPSLTPAQVKAAALAKARATYEAPSPTKAVLDEFGIPSVLTDVKRSTETPITDSLGVDAVDVKKKQAGSDPAALAADERVRLATAREGLGIDAEYQRQIDAQKALDAKATDPAAMKKADRNAILRGMALGGVRGSTLAQNNLAGNRAAGEQTRLDRMSKINTDRNTAKFETLKDIDTKAAEAFTMYSTAQTAAFNSLVGLTEAELGNVEDNFKNNVLYQQGEIKNVLDAASLTIANTTKEIAQGSLDLQKTINAQIAATKTVNDIRTTMMASQSIARLKASAMERSSDPSEVQEARNKIAELDRDIFAAQSDMFELIEVLVKRMATLN